MIKKINVNYNFLGENNLIYIIISKEDEFMDFIKNRYDDNFSKDDSFGMFYRPDEDVVLKSKFEYHNFIWINKNKFSVKKIKALNTVLHEVEHLVIRELERRQILLLYKDNDIYDEIFAYMYGEVGSKILNKLYGLNLK